MTEPAARLRLQIDSLVLEGIPSEAAGPLVRALRERLALLLAEDALSGQIDSASHVDAGAMDLNPGDAPSILGSRLASAVYRGMTSGARE